MKKWLCVSFLTLFSSILSAQFFDLQTVGSIDSIMEDNALSDVMNRYSSTQLTYFPEQATRLGFDSANNQLDTRTPERDSQAVRALRVVQDGLKKINRKVLSEPRKTEYDMLQARLQLEIQQLSQNRAAADPLLYAQVFDSLQDLRLKNLSYQDLQDKDLAARIHALPKVAQQAQNYLTSPASFLAQLAMERAYYAYLSFDEMPQYLLSRAQDDISRQQLRTDARAAKKAIKELFDLFKRLAQTNQDIDFRIGEKDYEALLKYRYFIDQKPRAILKYLHKNLQTAEQHLSKALSAFEVPSAQLEQEIISADIQVPDQEAADTVSITTIEQPKQVSTASKNKTQEPTTTLAAKFYAISELLMNQVENQNFISVLANEAKQLNQLFIQDSVMPLSNGSFNVKEMPAYYAYFSKAFFVPPFGNQANPTYDLYLRVPAGNQTTKQEMLNRDFNTPTLKLLITRLLVPGAAYRAAYDGQGLSSFRRMYPVPTLRNGWEVYAQHLANERGYIITDEEQLFLAWADYLRAAQALVDYQVHNRKLTYSEALTWLTDTQGIEKAQAEAMLKQIAEQPVQAVSYIYGYDALKNLRQKYQKKLGKKFSLSDFHAKVMGLGDIPLSRLEPEMEQAYSREKSHLSQALISPFYVN